MKKQLFLATLVGLSFSLTACGDKAEESNGQTILEDQLTIYSTHPEDLLEFVSAEFEEETGVKVDFINLKGQLSEKVISEKENPQADIMYGGSSAVYIEMEPYDVFEESTPSWSEEMNPLFKDDEGLWYGTIQTPVVMFYNHEMLDEEQAPKDWSDLIKPDFEGQLVFRDAGSSSAKAMYSSLLYQYDKQGEIEEGWEFMKALDHNTKKYYNSGSLQFQAIGREEASVSFAVLSAVVDNRDKGLPLEIVDAESGSPVITDGVAVIKGAKHPNAANAFVEFVGSPEMQAKIANEFNRMPTLEAALETSPQWMKEMKYKVMDVDWSVLSEKQSDWMQKWDNEIKDQSKQED